MHAFRARIAKDIVMEFLPPRRRSQRVIVICDGLPSLPSKFNVLDHFSRKGFWAVHPRYRGTWESEGEFLERSPHQDVLDVIGGLRKGFRDVWGGADFSVDPSSVHVIGASFGGAASLLTSLDPCVNGAVALSPVVDWRIETKAEPHSWLNGVVRQGYGGAYRFRTARWKRLTKGGFFDPASHTDEMDGDKLLIIHARDDDVVPLAPIRKFVRKTGAEFRLYAKGGHYSSSVLLTRRMQPHLWRFIRRTL